MADRASVYFHENITPPESGAHGGTVGLNATNLYPFVFGYTIRRDGFDDNPRQRVVLLLIRI